MWQIGVWERDEGLAERISSLAEGLPALVRACRHPALLAGLALDLLVVSPGASGWAGAGALACRTALLPGGLAALTRALPADALISYGPAPRNTLTLSSLDGQRASVAVQREFLTLDGRAVERQELILPYAGEPPELLLAQAGAALLLGRLPPG
ncbi:MAG: hypothetical protein HFF22_04990 [Oscillospiraceae bacterium]|jgi:hypothetical protein|nr:hypothetical protein [Oscillospiraceae bacterium]